jgi:hypothetical protein
MLLFSNAKQFKKAARRVVGMWNATGLGRVGLGELGLLRKGVWDLKREVTKIGGLNLNAKRGRFVLRWMN